jgi:hypothetical protein
VIVTPEPATITRLAAVAVSVAGTADGRALGDPAGLGLTTPALAATVAGTVAGTVVVPATG